MAGAIDPHTHIGGGKVTIARTLMPEDHEHDEVAHTALTRAGTGHALPSTMITGYRYAEMGYTACFEPAMLPANARQAHLELGDTPLLDKGAFVMLGSDDFMLRSIAEKRDFQQIKDYIAWTMHAAQAIAVKVVNPGGISAFKFNQRRLNLDEKHVYYGITPRDIILTLARGLLELGVTHPLHVHGCNLGIPGNVETTLATIRATDGLPLHLTHIQFHSYGTEGERHFSSGAAAIADLLKKYPHISIDVGQVMFGQTCTASGDSMRQYNGAKNADPKRWVVMDIECDAGCGVVPFRYRDSSYVHSLQWAIGLETFLLCEDPWRIFLTTDHPNGAPFYTYPHLIRLLMDRAFRKEMMLKVVPEALKYSTLPSLEREYSLYDIAILTRAGPARSLGLKDIGHLGPGALRRRHRLHRQLRPRGDVCQAGAGVQERRGHRARRQGGEGRAGRDPRRPARVRPRHREAAQGLLRPLPHHRHGELPPLRRGDRRRRPWQDHRATDQGAGVMKVNGITIDDTFAEAFGMSGTGVIITADSMKWARQAAVTMSGFGTSVIGAGAEVGIDRELKPEETPDGRPGVRVLLFGFSPAAVGPQLKNRVGQCVLTSPGSACYAGVESEKRDRPRPRARATSATASRPRRSSATSATGAFR